MRFLISVIDDQSGSGTPEEMSAINEFNDGMRAKNYLVFAGGLTEPKKATVIDNRSDANKAIDGPLFSTKENVSGFWIIDVPDQETARGLAFGASKACNRRVELREFFGN